MHNNKTKKNSRSQQPLFSQTDYTVVREALLSLSDLERDVILLRFWENYELLEISKYLGLRVKTIEDLITQAFECLKAKCLAHSEFSRNQVASMLAAA
jgi:DNA-directed RNA polymerase specialized sigma24 family protein